jgi:hypothetical protein
MQSHMHKEINKAIITILCKKSISITLSKYKDTYRLLLPKDLPHNS